MSVLQDVDSCVSKRNSYTAFLSEMSNLGFSQSHSSAAYLCLTRNPPVCCCATTGARGPWELQTLVSSASLFAPFLFTKPRPGEKRAGTKERRANGNRMLPETLSSFSISSMGSFRREERGKKQEGKSQEIALSKTRQIETVPSELRVMQEGN